MNDMSMISPPVADDWSGKHTPAKIVNGRTVTMGAPLQAIDPAYAQRVLAAFKSFLEPLRHGAKTIQDDRILEWVYSDATPPGQRESGMKLFGHAQTYDPLYSQAIRGQARLVRDFCLDLKQLSEHRLPFTDLGPGSATTALRDCDVVAALDSSHVDGVDIEPRNCKIFQRIIEMTRNGDIERTKVKTFEQDFKDPWPDALSYDQPRVVGVMGNTMAQQDMGPFLADLNEKTHGKALVYFDLYCDRNNAVTTYSGREFGRAHASIWPLLAAAADDPNFDCTAPHYLPVYNQETGVVEFTHIFMKETSLTVDGDTYHFPQGLIAKVGGAKIPDPVTVTDDIRAVCKKAGMELVKVYMDQATNVRGFVVKGNYFDLAYG